MSHVPHTDAERVDRDRAMSIKATRRHWIRFEADGHGRAVCPVCRQKIEKGGVRLAIESLRQGSATYFHPGCAVQVVEEFPRTSACKLCGEPCKKGARGVSAGFFGDKDKRGWKHSGWKHLHGTCVLAVLQPLSADLEKLKPCATKGWGRDCNFACCTPGVATSALDANAKTLLKNVTAAFPQIKFERDVIRMLLAKCGAPAMWDATKATVASAQAADWWGRWTKAGLGDEELVCYIQQLKGSCASAQDTMWSTPKLRYEGLSAPAPPDATGGQGSVEKRRCGGIAQEGSGKGVGLTLLDLVEIPELVERLFSTTGAVMRGLEACRRLNSALVETLGTEGRSAAVSLLLGVPQIKKRSIRSILRLESGTSPSAKAQGGAALKADLPPSGRALAKALLRFRAADLRLVVRTRGWRRAVDHLKSCFSDSEAPGSLSGASKVLDLVMQGLEQMGQGLAAGGRGVTGLYLPAPGSRREPGLESEAFPLYDVLNGAWFVAVARTLRVLIITNSPLGDCIRDVQREVVPDVRHAAISVAQCGNLETLVMRWCCLGPCGLAFVAEALAGQADGGGCPKLKFLDLSYNMDTDGYGFDRRPVEKPVCGRFFEHVASLTALQSLRLDANRMGAANANVRSLVEALEGGKLTALAHLHLPGNDMTAEANRLLASIGSRSLRSLDLSSCCLTHAGVSSLTTGLAGCIADNLTELDLGCNGLDSQAMADLGKLLGGAGSRCLTRLYLQGNPIGDTGVGHLAPFLDRIDDLDLACTGLGTQGLKLLCAGSVQSLRRLSLAANNIKTQALATLAKGLSNMSSLVALNLDEQVGWTEVEGSIQFRQHKLLDLQAWKKIKVEALVAAVCASPSLVALLLPDLSSGSEDGLKDIGWLHMNELSKAFSGGSRGDKEGEEEEEEDARWEEDEIFARDGVSWRSDGRRRRGVWLHHAAITQQSLEPGSPSPRSPSPPLRALRRLLHGQAPFRSFVGTPFHRNNRGWGSLGSRRYAVWREVLCAQL